MTAYQNPVNVFLSYAHKDKELLPPLEDHLSMLKREGLISTWCDRQIMPGTNWARVIDQHMEQATLILLLVSAAFLASDYCYQIEMTRALERHQAGQAIVIPIVARPVDWKTSPIAALQALPANAQPITTWSNPDEAFLEVTVGIRKAVEKLLSRSPDPAYKPWPVTNGSFSAGVDNQGANKPSEEYRGPGANLLTARTPDMYRQGSQPNPRYPSNPSPLPVPTPFGAPFPAIWNVPRRHNAFFTGRTPALEHLVNNFQLVNYADTISPQAITGLGGMGKTQVAAEYAFRWRGNYQAVLWVQAETQESLLADFRVIAALLKIPQERWRDQASLIQCMQEWFRTHSDWLLIFDNADNPALLEPFLQGAARGHFLATTRAGAVVSWAPDPLTLKALGADDGALCILRRAGLLTEQKQLSAAHPADVEAARQLAQLMEGLPLAMEQAGAYINDTECGVRGYRKLYDKFRKEIHALPSGQALRDYPETVVSVWKFSLSMMEQSHPAAADLLRLCAFLAPDGIPDDMIIAGADALGPVLKPVVANQFTLNTLIGILRKYSLLNRDVDREMDLTRISIHRIMQEVLVDEMDKRTQRLWAERAVRAVELASRSMTWLVLQSQARH
jgi:TIR domain-containing protein/NB-ARC domain-containing protein